MAKLFDPHFQAVDANGLPRSGAKLHFYTAGTTTPITIYQDEAGVTPLANPVIADSSGLFAPVFLAPSSNVKIVLMTSGDVTIQTIDDIATEGSPDASDVLFANAGTGLAAENVQDALEEVQQNLTDGIAGIEADYLPLTGGTVTGELAVEDGLAVKGRLASNAAIVSEFEDPADTLVALRRTGAASTTTEVAFLGYAQNDAAAKVKTFSISELMGSTAAATRWSVLRFNATYASGGVGVDYLGIRIFGGKGVTIDGLGDADHPGQYSTSYKCLIRAQTIHALPGTGSNTHFNFMNGAAANGVGTTVGSIVSSGSATAFNTSSDQEIKDDDGELTFERARAILDLMLIHNFRWKLDGKADIGVFAQELFKAYPNAVTPGYGKPGSKGFMPWSVDYSKLVPVLTRCVQGVAARQDAFETRLAALEAAN